MTKQKEHIPPNIDPSDLRKLKDRTMIAAFAMHALVTRGVIMPVTESEELEKVAGSIAKRSVAYADALLNELEK